MKHPTADDFDHARDLRKVDTARIPALPLFLQTPVPTAYTIAALCQGASISVAADLIEQYAKSMAATARLEEAQHIYGRLDRCMVKP